MKIQVFVDFTTYKMPNCYYFNYYFLSGSFFFFPAYKIPKFYPE